jgi:hypothetical protein
LPPPTAAALPRYHALRLGTVLMMDGMTEATLFIAASAALLSATARFVGAGVHLGQFVRALKHDFSVRVIRNL